MIWSTLAVTALVLVFYALVVRPDQVARPTVDVRGVVGEARRATGWQLGTVEGLGGLGSHRGTARAGRRRAADLAGAVRRG